MNDPQLVTDFTLMKRQHQTMRYGENMPLVLAFQAKDDHSRAVSWRICSDVGEAAVERDQNALLFPTDSRDLWIDLTAELLSHDCRGIPTRIA